MVSELDTYWPLFPYYPLLAGQIEQETCSTLTSKKCWNPKAELKTSREYGFGLAQLTIAYDIQGNVRFNTFEEVKAQFSALKDWQWDERYMVDMQIRSMILKMKFNFDSVSAADEMNQLKFAQLAYNGGLGSVWKDQNLCKRTENCDPGIWKGHLEKVSTKSRTPFGGVYGAQSPFSITRDYVNNIPKRAVKYENFISKIVAEKTCKEEPKTQFYFLKN